MFLKYKGMRLMLFQKRIFIKMSKYMPLQTEIFIFLNSTTVMTILHLHMKLIYFNCKQHCEIETLMNMNVYNKK